MIEAKIFIAESSLSRVRLKNVEERFARYRNGGWQKIVYSVLSDASLGWENVFECDVAIAGTPVSVTKRTIYYSGEGLNQPFLIEIMLRRKVAIVGES